MHATLTADTLSTLTDDQLRRMIAAWRGKHRDHYPDAVLDAVRDLTGQPPMPFLSPARKQAKQALRRIPWGRVTSHRDPTADAALASLIRRRAWRAALAQHLPDTVPARALDNLAILCAQ